MPDLSGKGERQDTAMPTLRRVKTRAPHYAGGRGTKSTSLISRHTPILVKLWPFQAFSHRGKGAVEAASLPPPLNAPLQQGKKKKEFTGILASHPFSESKAQKAKAQLLILEESLPVIRFPS